MCINLQLQIFPNRALLFLLEYFLEVLFWEKTELFWKWNYIFYNNNHIHHFVFLFLCAQMTLTFTDSLVNAALHSGSLETGTVMWWHYHPTLQTCWLNRSVGNFPVAASIMWLKPVHLPIPPAFTTVCTKMVVCRTVHRVQEVTALWLLKLCVVRIYLMSYTYYTDCE